MGGTSRCSNSGKPSRAEDVLSSAERNELMRLRRENKQLQQERDILANSSRIQPRPLAKKHAATKLVLEIRSV